MKTIIEDFIPQGGKHCITNSLKQIFTYYGYPMSEEMIFGLASGLSFLYLNQSDSPMVNGRIKVFEFEEKLAKRLGISIKCKSGRHYPQIFETTKQLIEEQNPVLIYTDMPYLKYLGMDPNSHFGGHAVVLFGFDDTAQKFFVSDRDNHDFPIKVPSGQIAEDYHMVDYAEIEKARRSSHRPFPANNKYLTFDFSGYKKAEKKVLCQAIEETCTTMLFPSAQLLGINGIKKFSKEILKWKQFSSQKLRLAGTTNYFQINEAGGTGGGIFRRMYGDFLIVCARVFQDERLVDSGQRFLYASRQWDSLALDLWQLSLDPDTELLIKMSAAIADLYVIEKDIYLSLLETVKQHTLDREEM